MQCSHIAPFACPNGWEPMSWTINTAERISAGVEHYLSQYYGRPERCPDGRYTISGCTADHELFEGLPPEVMSLVLESLDIHSKVRAKRTCALWDFLLPDPAADACIILDLANLSSQWPLQRTTEGYLLARLLHHTVNVNTHALVLYNLFHRNTDGIPLNYLTLIVQLLQIRCILRLIMLMNLRVRVSRANPRKEQDPEDDRLSVMYFYPLDFTNVCQRLFIRNYTVDFDCSSYSTDIVGSAFQHPMPGFVESKGSFFMSIRIPAMSFPYAESKEEKAECMQQFKLALEANCPPVDPAVKQRVMALHAQWVKTVPYRKPQWRELRHLLKFYGTYESPELCRFWRDVDVRRLDGVVLGNLQLTILARDYPGGAERTRIARLLKSISSAKKKVLAVAVANSKRSECTDTRISEEVFLSPDF
ncbi:uncharacterized protein LOC129600772 [Paramacrobiotus metropolitanus]|uniref:uncharacterized protein LOC129600772 n=1 Tax=Paramacrobiotus metropolitanus TaxID=2943436 RepID=UPI002445F38B|nr:uncharacterized protein LOC129600772 [Paramacrobiotus metropolitanus]